jgi:hypothetical protein
MPTSAPRNNSWHARAHDLNTKANGVGETCYYFDICAIKVLCNRNAIIV